MWSRLKIIIWKKVKLFLQNIFIWKEDIVAIINVDIVHIYIRMINLKNILEQVRGASQVEGTADADREVIPQEDITKELAKVGATDFQVTTIKGN